MTSSPSAPPGTNDQLSPIRSSRPAVFSVGVPAGPIWATKAMSVYGWAYSWPWYTVFLFGWLAFRAFHTSQGLTADAPGLFSHNGRLRISASNARS